jgi:hypothetical protein
MRLAKPADAAPVIAALSASRLSKYYAARPAALDALELYAWNAHVSASLMVPAHFAEVVTRNAVSDALTAIYGPRWPWDRGFELSLPNPYPPAYNPRRDLAQVRSKHQKGLLSVRLTSLTGIEGPREGCCYAEEVSAGVQA